MVIHCLLSRQGNHYSILLNCLLVGKTTNFAVVMAGLYSLGKFHGIHAFIVQLRDMKTHLPLPGKELVFLLACLA